MSSLVPKMSIASITQKAPRLLSADSPLSSKSYGDMSPRGPVKRGRNYDTPVTRGSRRGSFIHNRLMSRSDEDGNDERSKEIKRLQRRLVQKATETNCALQHIEQLTARHMQELENLRQENNRLLERNRLLNQKLERVPAFERYVIDMLLEYSEPHEDDIACEEIAKQLAKEKTAAEGRSAMENLDLLHTRFRRIVADHSDQENHWNKQLQALRDQLAAVADQNATISQSCVELQSAAMTSKELSKAALDSADLARQELQSEMRLQLEQLKHEKETLANQLHHEQQQVNRLSAMLEQRDTLLMEKEGRLLQIYALERQAEKDRRHHRQEVDTLRAQAQKRALQRDKEVIVMDQLHRERTELERNLKQARQQVHELKTTAHWQTIVLLEKNLKEALAKIQTLQATNVELQEQVDKLKGTVSYVPPSSRHASRETTLETLAKIHTLQTTNLELQDQMDKLKSTFSPVAPNSRHASRETALVAPKEEEPNSIGVQNVEIAPEAECESKSARLPNSLPLSPGRALLITRSRSAALRELLQRSPRGPPYF